MAMVMPSALASFFSSSACYLPPPACGLRTSNVSSPSSSIKLPPRFGAAAPAQLKAARHFVPRCSLDAAGGRPDDDDDTSIELKYAAFPALLDINQIQELLPHRYPFLMVDRVVELTPGKSAVSIKNVTSNENFFPGHFPGRPIMPGVLMVEAMAQTAGMVLLQPEVGISREGFYIAAVEKARFRKPVVAGDTLVMRITITSLKKRSNAIIAKVEGKAYVGGKLVCESEFLLVGNPI